MRRQIPSEPRTKTTRISHLLGLFWLVFSMGGSLVGYLLTETYGILGVTNWRTLMTVRVVISPFLPTLLALAFVPLAMVPGEAKGLRVHRALWILGLTIIPVFLGRNAVKDLLDGEEQEVRTIVERSTRAIRVRGARSINHFLTLDNDVRYYVNDQLFSSVLERERREAVLLVHTEHLLDLGPIVAGQ